MKPNHVCDLPVTPPSGARSYRCPVCMTRYVWSKRMIGRETREGWQKMRDDFDTRVNRQDAEMRPFMRMAIAGWAIGVLCLFAVLAVVVWIVLRVTS